MAEPMAETMNAGTVREQQKELKRLRRIENAALRVAGCRRFDGIVKDQRALDALDAALEARS